jgi:hypothetical protein
MQRTLTLLTAVLALAPAASLAQELVVEKNTTVVVKEAPKPSPITFTPYGFIMLNALFNDAPFAAPLPGRRRLQRMQPGRAVPDEREPDPPRHANRVR